MNIDIWKRSTLINQEEGSIDSKLQSADQDESQSESRIIDIKKECDKKTSDELEDIILKELFGENRHKVEEENLCSILDSFSIKDYLNKEYNESRNKNKGFRSNEAAKRVCKSLEARMKWQRLLKEEKVYLYGLLKQSNANISHIMQNYNVSRGTLTNICMELNKEVVHWSTKWKRSSRDIINCEWIAKAIWKYVKSMNYPYTARDVSWYIYKAYRVRISPWIIRRILKDFGMSYKIGKSRPVDYDEVKLSLMKGLFSIKLSKAINNYELLINIDETMFSRTTKTLHSWSLKGEEA